MPDFSLIRMSSDMWPTLIEGLFLAVSHMLGPSGGLHKRLNDEHTKMKRGWLYHVPSLTCRHRPARVWDFDFGSLIFYVWDGEYQERGGNGRLPSIRQEHFFLSPIALLPRYLASVLVTGDNRSASGMFTALKEFTVCWRKDYAYYVNIMRGVLWLCVYVRTYPYVKGGAENNFVWKGKGD